LHKGWRWLSTIRARDVSRQCPRHIATQSGRRYRAWAAEGQSGKKVELRGLISNARWRAPRSRSENGPERIEFKQDMGAHRQGRGTARADCFRRAPPRTATEQALKVPARGGSGGHPFNPPNLCRWSKSRSGAERTSPGAVDGPALSMRRSERLPRVVRKERPGFVRETAQRGDVPECDYLVIQGCRSKSMSSTTS